MKKTAIVLSLLALSTAAFAFSPAEPAPAPVPAACEAPASPETADACVAALQNEAAASSVFASD